MVHLRRRQQGWIAPVAVLALGILLVVIVIALRPKPGEAPPEEPYIPLVSVIKVELREASPMVNTTGRVASRFEISLVSRVGGVMEEASANFRAGASFTQGEILLRLEDSDYRSQLAQAQASLASAQQQLATEQGLARQAEREWRDLGNEQANALFLRKPQIEAAIAQLEAARAAVERARSDLERTRITAPFDGVVVSVNANEGQYINPGSTVAVLHSTAELQVETSLSATELQSLGWDKLSGVVSGIPMAQLKSTLLEGQYQALVRHISPRVEPMTQLTPVLLDLTGEASRQLTPGQFVQLKLFGSPAPDLAWIPETALFERTQVLLVTQGKIELAPIKILARDSDQLLVSGLQQGDLIVVSRPLWVFPGQQVEPVLEES